VDLLSPDDFLELVGRLQIGFDRRYPACDCLVYLPHRPHARFWEVPQPARAIPFFVAHLLGGLERWSHCYIWPRGGRWLELAEEDERMHTMVQATILSAAGVPAGTEGAVRYGADEQDRLVTALFAQLVFGWSVPDDVFVVPDHGRYFLWADHHDVVHVQFRDAAGVEPFVEHMAREGYALPDDVPDDTFKRPGWMP
jgi:hypothetical protein